MKMIYVGTLAMNPDRDSQWIKSFESLGICVIPFSTIFINKTDLISKIKIRLHLGTEINKMRKGLIKIIENEKPDWVHFRLPVEFDQKTLKLIKSKNIVLTEYFNDDPFSNKRVKFYYRLFKNTIKLFDIHYVYRSRNIGDFKKFGGINVFHCPPAFVPWRHFKIDDNNEFNYDAVFIGHWEDDWRVRCLESIANEGYSVMIKGGMWNTKINKSKVLNHLYPINGIYNNDYNLLYGNAIAGLCFFSKINRDLWTERALEIIAVGGILVCERTVEAEMYFKDKVEAFYFSSIEELLKIIKFLKNNPEIRQTVKNSGLEKLKKGRHSVLDRAEMISQHVNELKHLKN
jgi:spore maturation protein CgeB